ncbi:PREDICTED: interleukin-21 receptor [Condylura cristata]|uniref:interleukin-21 receptor n=1 Tax=Condylura cristata TaxID=143302 RepID=UPI0003344B37|nr:PREDICTED: interleukin-21 receptor [Condylura cristata]
MPCWAIPLLLLLLLQGAWGCSDLVCYTDYFQTITCILETITLQTGMLTLTWQDSFGELKDEVTSCSLHQASFNATHTMYMCHMDVFLFMADDIFIVTETDPYNGSSQECGSFVLAMWIKPSPPFNVTVTFSEHYNISWCSNRAHALKGKLQYELQYWSQEEPWVRNPQRKLISVDVRSISLLSVEFRQGASYQLQMRAGPQPESFFQGTWSEWSDPVVFETESEIKGELPSRDNGNIYIILVLISIALILLFLKINHQPLRSQVAHLLLPPRLWKKVLVQVPSPEKFFQPLYIGHRGDFKTWVGTPFTASSLELGTWSPGAPSTLEICHHCPPQSVTDGSEHTELPETAELAEADGLAEPDAQGPAAPRAGSVSGSAASQERPYGLVSIDTVTVVGAEEACVWPCACRDDGYPALNLDTSLEPGPDTEDPLLGSGATVLSYGCVSSGGPAVLGGHLGSLLSRLKMPLAEEAGWTPSPPWPERLTPGVSDSEAGSPLAGMDMDTFDSGFADSDCGSPVERDFTGPRDEGPPRSYLRQWVVKAPPASGRGPQASE